MNEGPVSHGNMIETTDALEAVSVFRGWKNFFFLIVLICMLLAQAAFWLVNLDVVKLKGGAPAGVAGQADDQALAAAASAALADANEAASKKVTLRFPADLLDDVDFSHVARAVDLVNGILIVAAAVYIVAMFFSLMVSVTGRLGGISHISRAFFLSMIGFILLIPWQRLFGTSVVGVIYTPAELLDWLALRDKSTLNMVLFYLRFAGYWFLVFLLLLTAQVRSARWTKAILRRLEII